MKNSALNTKFMLVKAFPITIRRVIAALCWIAMLTFPGCVPTPSDTPGQNGDPSDAVEEEAAPESGAPQLLSEEDLAEGWIQLFDRQTLFGWKPSAAANWRVEEGAIVVDDGEAGLLCTTTQFSDYVLQLEFKADPKTNSGVFLHTPLQPQDPAMDCYELNIAAETVSPFPTGSLVERKKSEGRGEKGEEGDGWHKYEIKVEGDTVTVKLDGEEVLNYQDPDPLLRGHIGLQHNQGRVAFRNIKLKPLGMQSIFNGEDLTGWNEDFQGESQFTVTDDGELNVKNGKGQLETSGTYGDFVLQLECISHAPGLNSGIFFRCIPGEEMNGYESQIHNGFKDNDRTQPEDCGTGGIFRRQNARRVVADDEEWFHKTIIADGPHMAVWVNGYQVSDWTDDREPDPNPRRGLRTEPGTIQIQGHDPTTNLSFRNLEIAEMGTR